MRGYAGMKLSVMSDMYRGDGTGADDFAQNSLVHRCAPAYYLENSFTYTASVLFRCSGDGTLTSRCFLPHGVKLSFLPLFRTPALCIS
jgi:hypothetical protein